MHNNKFEITHTGRGDISVNVTDNSNAEALKLVMTVTMMVFSLLFALLGLPFLGAVAAKNKLKEHGLW